MSQYVLSRVKAEASEGARAGTERVLADYRHDQEKALARIETDNQRRLQEFSLYTQKQHEVYASLYKRVRIAADRLSSRVGFTILPDFSKYSVEDVRNYVKDHNISGRLGDPVIEAYKRDVDKNAVKLMEDLDQRVWLWKAERSFDLAKNAEALNELYLSDDVRLKLMSVRERMSSFLVAVKYPERGEGVATLGKRDDMNLAVTELYHLMRNELRRGESSVLPAG